MNKLDNKLQNIFIDASPMSEVRLTGIPHFTAELVSALDKHKDNGMKFNIVLLVAFDKRKMIQRWNYENVQIRSIPIPGRLLNLIWKYRLLPPMDIFFGKGTYLFPNYKNWPLYKSKCLTYIHDLGYIRHPQFVQPKNLKFLQNGMKIWTKRSGLILTGSENAKMEISKLLKIRMNKIVRIYHGVEHETYRKRSRDEIIEVKNKYNIKGEYLITIGSFEPRKNLIRLIEAYQQLPEKIRSTYSLCLVGGGGWLNEEIFAMINEAQDQGYNIVRPNNYVEDEDLPALISGAVLLVHPALYEGFGLPPLQAMACGTPVAVSNNTSLPEVVGDAGILFNEKDPKDISVKINKVLSDKILRLRMIESGISQAMKFSWNKCANQLLEHIYTKDES